MQRGETRRGAISRRAFVAGGAAALGAALLPRGASAQAPLVLNDASRLNPTPVMRHLVVRDSAEDVLIAALRRELDSARRDGRAVSMGCARHSMGGQSLYPLSKALTFATAQCEPDAGARVFRAGAGTRWRDVIRTLDKAGFSPAVMQSNNDFGIAGTLSVNAHGWPAPFGPFGATVRSFRLMLADGSVLRCAREENPELFGLVTGGYGLFGIILDAEVDMVENALLEPTFEVMAASDFGPRFAEAVTSDPRIVMAYGRLAVHRGSFFDEALMITYRPLPAPEGGVPAAESGGFINAASREIFRAQIGRDWVKRARWFTESVAAPSLLGGEATRNTLLNEPVANLAGGDPGRTDILHEYFLPPDRFGEFLSACDEIIPNSQQELLNVTLRYVAADADSVLRYAPEPRVAAVMLFSQEISEPADADMARMTAALIDRAIALGGSFYLPYRLHASRDQVRTAYPGVAAFLERKRHYDPGLLFRNALWDAYLAD